MYRIIYKKQDGKYYCQFLENYISWFGFGKEKTRWVYLKKWYEGSIYPPYSEDTYEPYFFGSLESAKEYLYQYIEKSKKPEIEVVYSSEEKFKTNPYLHSDEWDLGIPKK